MFKNDRDRTATYESILTLNTDSGVALSLPDLAECLGLELDDLLAVPAIRANRCGWYEGADGEEYLSLYVDLGAALGVGGR